MSYTVQWNGNNVLVSMKGKINFNDIDLVDGILYGDERFEKMAYQIFDLTEIESFDLTEQDMHVIGVLDKNSSQWNKKMKVAIISSDENVKKLVRVYQEVMETTEWEVELFSALTEAQKWCTLVNQSE